MRAKINRRHRMNPRATLATSLPATPTKWRN
jgi:hypothetical protein